MPVAQASVVMKINLNITLMPRVSSHFSTCILYLHHHGVLWIHKSADLNLVTFRQWDLPHLFNFQTNEIVLDKAKGLLGNKNNPFFFMIPVINSENKKNKKKI